MRSLNMDSKVMQFFAHLADLILLSFFFVITCIPVITIGPSIAALYGVFRETGDQDSSILRRYLHQFRNHFRPALICWLIQLSVSGLLVLDIYLLRRVDTNISSALLFISFLLFLLVNLTCSLVYPQIAFYNNSIRQYWINAFLLLLSKFWLTAPNVLLFLLPELVLLAWPKAYFFCMIVRLFPGIGVQFYLSFLMVKHLFQLVSPAEN